MIGHQLPEHHWLQRNVPTNPEGNRISTKFIQDSRRHSSSTHNQYYFIAPFIKEVKQTPQKLAEKFFQV